MTKSMIILGISLTLIVAIVNAEHNNLTEIETNLDEENKDNSTDVGTSRKHFLPLYGGSALLGFGGLHALAILYAIKVKIIIVAVVIALAIYYYSKILIAKKCLHSELLRDSSPFDSFPNGISGYSNSPPPDFSYSGPDPYSAYSGLHPDISSIEHLHHHATGFDDIHPDVSSFDHDHHPDVSTFDHDHHPGHESVPDSFGAGSDPSVSASQQGTAAAGSTESDNSKMTRRVYNQMRQLGNPIFDNINWAEIAFQFLGVDTDGCRRRFTCELDYRVKGNPFTKFVFSMVSPRYFNKYRDLSKDAIKPTSFADCARLHRECKEAEKYDVEEEEIEEVTEPAENSLNEESNRQIYEPLGRLILKRSEK